MEYLKFTRELLAYLKYRDIHRIFNFGLNDEFDSIPSSIGNKDIHLLFPMYYYPRIQAEIVRRKAGSENANGFEPLKPGEYWKYEYDIDSEYIELFFAEYPDIEYYLVIEEPVKKFLKYPKSYKAWFSRYKAQRKILKKLTQKKNKNYDTRRSRKY